MPCERGDSAWRGERARLLRRCSRVAEELTRACTAVIRSQIARVPAVGSEFDDVVQDAWLELIRKIRRLGATPARAEYLRLAGAIAWRLAIKRARRRPARPLALCEAQAEMLVDPGPKPEIELDWTLAENRLRRLVEDFLAGLEEPERKIATMLWLAERSLSDIAALVQVSEDAAWGHVRRCRAKFAAHLLRQGLSHLENEFGMKRQGNSALSRR